MQDLMNVLADNKDVCSHHKLDIGVVKQNFKFENQKKQNHQDYFCIIKKSCTT